MDISCSEKVTGITIRCSSSYFLCLKSSIMTLWFVPLMTKRTCISYYSAYIQMNSIGTLCCQNWQNMHPLRNHRAGLCCCLCLTPSRLRSGMTEATIRWGTYMWPSSWRECQIANDLSDPFSFCLLSLNCSRSTFGFHSRDQCLNNRCYPSYWCTNKHSRSSWYEVM